jgi:medium-chain acyl-[acyl-carrier-protein] hydrolase
MTSGAQVVEHPTAPAVKPAAWVQRFAIRPAATLRLFCFSYAGAGASVYRLWHTALPAELEVCAIALPGRESRLHEPPLPSIPQIVAALLPVIRAHADRPFAFFGHSMGAVVASELARALQADAGPLPVHLFVSARRPCGIADPDTPLAHLPDAQLVAELNRRYGGIPAEVLQHRELLALLLPGLRADLAALESFGTRSGSRFTMPLTAYGGTNDARAPRAHIEAWQAEAAAAFRLRQFDGDHFYLNPQRTALLEDLRSTLAPWLTGSAGSGLPA